MKETTSEDAIIICHDRRQAQFSPDATSLEPVIG
jgi:hypothetical protein